MDSSAETPTDVAVMSKEGRKDDIEYVVGDEQNLDDHEQNSLSQTNNAAEGEDHADESGGADAADAEDDEEASVEDEGTSLWLRVAEMESLSFLKQARQRRDLERRVAQTRLLAGEKQSYAEMSECLKDSHPHTTAEASPMSTELRRTVATQMQQAPELAALLLRLSSFVYRIEGVESQIAASKQWNQTLTQQRQVAQHSQLGAIDRALAAPSQQVITLTSADGDSAEAQTSSSAVPSASVSTDSVSRAVESLRQSATFLPSTRKALSGIRDSESRSRLGRLVDVWERLVEQAEHRAATAATITSSVSRAERVVDAACAANPLWDIMASQETLHRATNQAASSAALREDDLLRQNTELQQRKASLELALAAALSSRQQTSSLPSRNTEVRLQQRLREVTASLSRKQARRDAVARELVTLRRAAPQEADTGVPADATARQAQAHLAKTTAVMGRALLQHVTEQLCQTLAAADTETNGTASPSRLLVDEAIEEVLSQQLAINTLVADNAVLWQQVQDVRLAETVATEPDKVSKLEDAVLLQCGAASWEEKREDAGEDGLVSLRALEEELLRCVSTNVTAMAEVVTASYAKLESRCLADRRQLLQDAEALVRLVHVRASTAGIVSDSAAAASLRHLRKRLRVARRRPLLVASASLSSGEDNTLPVPAISLEMVQTARRRLADVAEQSQAAVQSTWTALEEKTIATGERLQWYAQHPLDRVEADLRDVHEVREQLAKQSDALKMSHAHVQQTHRDAAALSAQLETLRTQTCPTLQETLREAEQAVAALEARAPLWHLLREEQHDRYEMITAAESTEFQRITDVATRVLQTLWAAVNAEAISVKAPHTDDDDDDTAPAPEDAVKVETPTRVKPENEEEPEQDEEGQENLTRSPPQDQATVDGLAADAQVKEEPAEEDASLPAPTDEPLVVPELPDVPQEEEEEEEEGYGTLAPDDQLDGDEETMAVNTEGNGDVDADDEAARAQWDEEMVAPNDDSLAEDAENAVFEVPQGETSPFAGETDIAPFNESDHPEDATEMPEEAAPQDEETPQSEPVTTYEPVSDIKKENGDDPFFSGPGFGDD